MFTQVVWNWVPALLWVIGQCDDMTVCNKSTLAGHNFTMMLSLCCYNDTGYTCSTIYVVSLKKMVAQCHVTPILLVLILWHSEIRLFKKTILNMASYMIFISFKLTEDLPREFRMCLKTDTDEGADICHKTTALEVSIHFWWSPKNKICILTMFQTFFSFTCLKVLNDKCLSSSSSRSGKWVITPLAQFKHL